MKRAAASMARASQMIDCRRQSADGLDEQRERLILKGIGKEADGAKPYSDAFTRSSSFELSKSQRERNREINARLMPTYSEGSSNSRNQAFVATKKG